MPGQVPTQERLGRTNWTPWFCKEEKVEDLQLCDQGDGWIWSSWGRRVNVFKIHCTSLKELKVSKNTVVSFHKLPNKRSNVNNAVGIQRRRKDSLNWVVGMQSWASGIALFWSLWVGIVRWKVRIGEGMWEKVQRPEFKASRGTRNPVWLGDQEAWKGKERCRCERF